MRYIPAYFVALCLFLVLDGLWLGVVARGFYAERMGELMTDSPRWGAAVVFYLLFLVGLIYFAVSTGLATGDWRTAALNGALFGFFCYLTYDATGLAVIKGFDTTMAVVDVIWGTVLGAVVAGATVFIVSAFGWFR